MLEEEAQKPSFLLCWRIFEFKPTSEIVESKGEYDEKLLYRELFQNSRFDPTLCLYLCLREVVLGSLFLLYFEVRSPVL